MRFRRIGLWIELKKFGLDLPIKPTARNRKDMRDFVFDMGDYLEKVTDPVYLMYRGVGSLNPDFRKASKKFRVRYDLTLIKEGRMGPSYIRTAGHYHPGRYSEIYEVIHGKAAFVMQSKDLKKMMIVLACAGEAAVVPPGFGHQTVNIGRTPLLVANLVCGDFKSDYSVYRKKHGGAFYLNGYKSEPLYVMINLDYDVMPSKFPKIKKIKGRKLGDIGELFLKNPRKMASFLRGTGSF